MNAAKIAPELCPPKVEPEWNQCTTRVLLVEALACLTAVEKELRSNRMSEEATEIHNAVQSLEDILSREQEIKDWIIKNYKAKLREIRMNIRNKPRPTGEPDLPPWQKTRSEA